MIRLVCTQKNFNFDQKIKFNVFLLKEKNMFYHQRKLYYLHTMTLWQPYIL